MIGSHHVSAHRPFITLSSTRPSCPWMELLVHRTKVLSVDVRIDLGSREVGVPEHLLYGSKIRPSFQEVCGKGMPQRVRGDALLNPGPICTPPDDSPRAHPAQRPPSCIEEQLTSGLTAIERRAHFARIEGNGTKRPPAEGHQPFLGTLPKYSDQRVVVPDVAR